MGSGERAEDSSSPSARLSLLSARPTGTSGERISIELSDGSRFFVTQADLRQEGLSVFELYTGLELAPDVCERLKERSRLGQIRDKALSLLARAPHSSKSLELKLIKRGYQAGQVGQVLEDLLDRGYLDDRRYAEEWLRSRLAHHPEGRSLLIAGLMRRGVQRRVAETATRQMLSPEDERRGALKALEKIKRRGEPPRAELVRRLRARGFPSALIRELVPEAGRDD